MAMTWTTFTAALDGADDASAALNALIEFAMPDLQDSLDLVGAAEAGPLLASALKAEASERRAHLDAALEILDARLDTIAPHDPETDYSNVMRTALVGSLIDAELGGDPETRRRRAALAAEAYETHLASSRSRLGKRELSDEAAAGRLVLAAVFKLVVQQFKPHRASRLRGRRRGRE
jgi:hypothetical protein